MTEPIVKFIDRNQCLLSGFMSREATFSIYVNGRITPAGVHNIIEQLTMMRGWLLADDIAQRSLEAAASPRPDGE